MLVGRGKGRASFLAINVVVAAVMAATSAPTATAADATMKRRAQTGERLHGDATGVRVRALGQGRLAVSLPIWRNFYDWPGGHQYAGWDLVLGTSDANAYGSARSLGGIPGLWLWLTGGREYRPGFAEWRYEAPGTTRIASANLAVAYAEKLFAHHCVELGLRRPGETRDSARECSPPDVPASPSGWTVTLDDPASEPTATQAYFRVEMPVCNNPADTPCSKWIPLHDPLTNGPFARVKDADLVLVDDDLPAVTASGPFRALDGAYIAGMERYALTVRATDAGAGIARASFNHLGVGSRALRDAGCDLRHGTPALAGALCPPSYEDELTVDSADLSEGAHRFDASATDPAENTGRAEAWEVRVDRTPPGPPLEPEVVSSAGNAHAAWNDAEDPDLADGTPGSGLAGYRVRHRIADGDWTGWVELDADANQSDELLDLPAGTKVDYEIVTFDAVGNESEPVLVSGTVEAAPEDDDTDGFIVTPTEVFNDTGEQDEGTCTFRDVPRLVVGADDYGAYEQVLDVSMDTCVRTIEAGTLAPAPGTAAAAARAALAGSDVSDAPVAAPRPRAMAAGGRNFKKRIVGLTKVRVGVAHQAICCDQARIRSELEWVYNTADMSCVAFTDSARDNWWRSTWGWDRKHESSGSHGDSCSHAWHRSHAHLEDGISMLLLKVIKYVPMPKKIKDAVKKALNLTKKIKAPCHMEIHANEATLRGWNDGTFSYESNTTAYLEGLLGLCKSVLNPIADAGGLGGSAVLPIEAKTWRLSLEDVTR